MAQPKLSFFQNIFNRVKQAPQQFQAAGQLFSEGLKGITKAPSPVAEVAKRARENRPLVESFIQPARQQVHKAIDKVPNLALSAFSQAAKIPLKPNILKEGAKIGAETVLDSVPSALRGVEYLTSAQRRKEVQKEGAFGTLGAVGDVAGLVPVGGGFLSKFGSKAKTISKYFKPAKNAVEDQTIKHVVNNLDQVKNDYTKRVLDKFGDANVVSADEGKFVIPGFKGTNAAEYHEASSGFAKLIYDEKLKANKGTRNNTVLFMSGGTGAGKTTAVKTALKNLGTETKNYPIVYDTNLSGVESSSKKIQDALKNGYEVDIMYVQRDPEVAFREGVLPRVRTESRIVTMGEHIKRHKEAFETLEELKKKYGDQINVQYVDNTGSRESVRVLDLDKLPKFDYNESRLKGVMENDLNKAVSEGRITEEEAKAIRGTGQGTQDSGRIGSSIENEQVGLSPEVRGQPQPQSPSGTAGLTRPFQPQATQTTTPLTEAPTPTRSDLTSPFVQSSSTTIPQPVKIPQETGKLNVEKLNLDQQQKQFIRDIDPQLIRQRITDDELKRIARQTGIDTKSHSVDDIAKKAAAQLNTRNNIVSLTNQRQQLLDSGASPEQLEEITQEIAKQTGISETQGTLASRLLSVRKIIANDLDTPMQKVFRLLDKAGVNPEVYGKKAAKVDFNDPNAVTDFYRSLAPAKARDWIDALRYNSMLSSPLTHIVNATSNLLGGSAVAPIEKTVTGAVDFIGSALTGKKQNRFMMEGPSYFKGYVSALPEAFNRFGEVLGGTKPITNLDFQRVPLATKGVKKYAANLLETPMKLLEASDQFFSALAEAGETAGLKVRQSRGVDVGDIAQTAKEKALYRTFRQPRKSPDQGSLLNGIDDITGKIMQLRNSEVGWVRTLANFTLPFVQTPMNIAKQGIEYSPLGIGTVPGAANKSEQIAKTVMGMSAALGGAMLLGSGRLTWSEPTDPTKKAAFRESGRLPYSVKLGDQWVQYNKLPPVLSFNLALISSIDDMVKNGQLGQDWADNILSGVAKYGSFLGDQTYAKQVGDLMNLAKGDKESYSRLISNYPQQLVPFRALGGWLARMTDEYQRVVDPDAGFIDKQVQQLMQNIPGLSDNLEPRKGPTGEPIKNQNPLLNAFSPFRVSEENQQAGQVYDELGEISKLRKGSTIRNDEIKDTVTDMYTQLKNAPEESKRALFEEFIGDGRLTDETAKKLLDLAEEELNPTTASEKSLRTLALPDKAKYITGKIQALQTNEEKLKYLEDLQAKGVITDNLIEEIVNQAGL